MCNWGWFEAEQEEGQGSQSTGWFCNPGESDEGWIPVEEEDAASGDI